MKNLIAKYCKVQSRLTAKKGATMVEYALILALIAAATILTYQGIQTNIKNKLSTVASAIAGT